MIEKQYKEIRKFLIAIWYALCFIIGILLCIAIK